MSIFCLLRMSDMISLFEADTPSTLSCNDLKAMVQNVGVFPHILTGILMEWIWSACCSISYAGQWWYCDLARNREATGTLLQSPTLELTQLNDCL